jgi:hypothetical protein
MRGPKKRPDAGRAKFVMIVKRQTGASLPVQRINSAVAERFLFRPMLIAVGIVESHGRGIMGPPPEPPTRH